MIKDGNKFANAETIIDYKNKDIKFNYNNKEYDKKGRHWENMAFFWHSYYQFLALFISLFMLYIWAEIVPQNPYLVDEVSFITFFFTGLAFVYLAPKVLMGYTSIIVHRLSKTARNNFPVSNAILQANTRWKKIDLSENKEVYPEGFKNSTKFLHWKYNIGRFEYSYIGENKLIKVYTKSREKIDKKGEHFKYICIFEFEKPITDGIILWR